ncbi:MAG: 30S ribosomal protein S6 [Muribaculaceae bacterium]|nr:30S ribosomal protein S6 [Muribaculaceae bacterium]MBQ1722756.1 30S ribosomal protein S6 [Muribaculaceae bacterium]MBQ5465907.1 30S ribosomal protein S6 [Muribaculaceae bacterium]
MNHYETVFILTPVLSDPQMKEAVEKFKGVLTDNGATIVNEENWGLRKLAYPIQKKSTGFYTLIEFDAEPTIVKILETAFRRDEKVLRFLTFHLDKFAEEYAIKRRSLKKNAPKAEEAPVVEEAPVAEPQEVVEEAVENNND